ncbi:hypothetical protein HK097_004434 [Rhizophlyctis rosea]|uniref:Uncharacterized protein n=1 Tax=Rhizophlyctis rosea TaxID=64517 RepID=A0AAD5S1K0_9FUNG|nr:hypothetical protein HK097_004434 [Rhizophlyctis rosea]
MAKQTNTVHKDVEKHRSYSLCKTYHQHKNKQKRKQKQLYIKLRFRTILPIPTLLKKPQCSLLPLLPPRIQTDEEITLRQSDRDRLVSDSEKRQEEVRRLRAEDRDRRSRAKVLQSEKVDEKSKDVEELRKFDFGRRDTYRQRVIREIEDAQAKTRAAMEAAMRAAESAADQVAAEEAAAAQAAAEKNKKKGGKR